MTEKQKLQQLLTDEEFIRCMLEGGESLTAFKQEYTAREPGNVLLLQTAEHRFHKVRLDAETMTMSDADFAALWQRIERVSDRHEGKRINLWRYVAACAAFIVVSATAYYIYKGTQQPERHVATIGVIMEQNLEDREIRLTTSSGTTTFADNINISVREDGTIQVEDPTGNTDLQSIPAAETQTDAKTIAAEPAPQLNRISVPYGKRSQLTLADGTHIWLNSGTTLEFPSAFTDAARTVSLQGEIYLEVAHDPSIPFIVNTSDIEISVLGTSLDVSAYAGSDSQTVALVEGSVAVKNRFSGKHLTIKPGELAVSDVNGLETHPADLKRYISWKEGFLIFDDTPLPEALQRIEQYYNLRFSIPDSLDLRNITCSGKLSLSLSLDNVLETMFSQIPNVSFRRENNLIYIEL
ncbi:MAG: FecR domain-containing protein [Tannerella sp.]|jgi:hypothetical protein|nr:FecR domain-containing protein [Tannerella sp.]